MRNVRGERGLRAHLKILRVVVTVVVTSGSKVEMVKKMNDWPIAEHSAHLPTWRAGVRGVWGVG